MLLKQGERIAELGKETNSKQLDQYKISPQELREFNGIKLKYNKVENDLKDIEKEEDKKSHIQTAIDALEGEAKKI